MATALVQLPIYCVQCGRPVTLQLDRADDQRDKSSWTCPWCEKENAGQFPGHLVDVSRGHSETRGKVQ